uniref:Transmembrane protein n=1 Tax=Chromera velia CCMP2878 TaxID=1169474 RepID=A0A0G4HP92_9ALVE|eukprot:Cvel_29670.t1-p1 / transcript=Cvel_29670.t1 / gene=Cvel_29670 / organism=Chromera_velia_CCMP2878 / gene_product=hypothetical protein / transcript_product=hypothetical protein / location=Cvel_scaffold4101:3304-6390(-) / protein_length=409 / sequence_SO=supercontig / SO=protein_coding / is_pseudo=false
MGVIPKGSTENEPQRVKEGAEGRERLCKSDFWESLLPVSAYSPSRGHPDDYAPFEHQFTWRHVTRTCRVSPLRYLPASVLVVTWIFLIFQWLTNPVWQELARTMVENPGSLLGVSTIFCFFLSLPCHISPAGTLLGFTSTLALGVFLMAEEEEYRRTMGLVIFVLTLVFRAVPLWIVLENDILLKRHRIEVEWPLFISELSGVLLSMSPCVLLRVADVEAWPRVQFPGLVRDLRTDFASRRFINRGESLRNLSALDSSPHHNGAGLHCDSLATVQKKDVKGTEGDEGGKRAGQYGEAPEPKEGPGAEINREDFIERKPEPVRENGERNHMNGMISGEAAAESISEKAAGSISLPSERGQENYYFGHSGAHLGGQQAVTPSEVQLQPVRPTPAAMVAASSGTAGRNYFSP